MRPFFIIDDVERPGLLHLLPQVDDGTEDVGLGMVDVAGQPGSSRVSTREQITHWLASRSRYPAEISPANPVDIVHLEPGDARPLCGERRQFAVDEPPQLVIG